MLVEHGGEPALTLAASPSNAVSREKMFLEDIVVGFDFLDPNQ